MSPPLSAKAGRGNGVLWGAIYPTSRFLIML